MGWLRRVLIELWAMVALSAVVGFLGPFGTYFDGDFPSRSWHWWMQLMGAYLLVRPSILLWTTIADAAALPRKTLLFWGVFLSSFPLALLWTWSAHAFFHDLQGFAGILPFAMLSALGVLAITVWARRADEQFGPASEAEEAVGATVPPSAPGPLREADGVPSESGAHTAPPRLTDRLSLGFPGPVIALQSEDHYVRVHSRAGSELVFMRLRDAISEMDGAPGEQVHRSWWIAEGGIASVEADGRRRALRLLNGARAPVARDSVARLERTGFLRDPSLQMGHAQQSQAEASQR